MASAAQVGLSAGDEQLAAAGRQSGAVVGAGDRQREVTEKHEVDQREEEPVEEAAGLLMREATGQIDTPRVEKSHGACHGVRLEGDVGIEEEEDVVTGRLRELKAGVLFAAPSGRERLTTDESHPRIFGGEVGDDPRGVVPAVVVEDDQLEVNVAVGEHGGGEPADDLRLVAGRDEHRDPRRRSPGGWPRRASEEAEVGERQPGWERGEGQRWQR